MKILIIAALFLTSCSVENKIAVRSNYRGPVHYEKFKEVDGKILVRGKEVRLIPNTCIYAKTK